MIVRMRCALRRYDLRMVLEGWYVDHAHTVLPRTRARGRRLCGAGPGCTDDT